MNKILVQKFGGKSLDNEESIRCCALYTKNELLNFNNIIVVVSAMGDTTNFLYRLIDCVSCSSVNEREKSIVVSTGEQISAGLFAIALHSHGVESVISLMPWQTNIRVYSKDRKRITIDERVLLNYCQKYKIIVIPGFQALDALSNVVTLVRGGSDITAAEISVAVKADRCDIYKDVDGIFTSDPKIVKNAIKLDKISYDDLLLMTKLGANVLHNMAANIFCDAKMCIRIISSKFSRTSGTYITEHYKTRCKFFVINKCDDGKHHQIFIVGIDYNDCLKLLKQTPWISKFILSIHKIQECCTKIVLLTKDNHVLLNHFYNLFIEHVKIS